MQRASRRVGAVAALAACALGAGVPGLLATGGAAAATSGARTALPGSAPTIAATTQGTSAVASGKSLTVQLWLTPDIAGATQFADAVSTPGSAQYHQYLSPAAYTATYGATAAEATAVSSWLTSAGLKHVSVSAQRDYVAATGSVAKIDRAFATQMRNYSVTGANGKPTTVRSNATALSLPSSLSGDVLAVTGLDSARPTTNLERVHARHTSSLGLPAGTCSQYWDQLEKPVKPSVNGITTSPLLSCGYSADQLRAAYGQTGGSTGVGQTVALIEVGVPVEMFQTLTDYAAFNGLPAPQSTQFREEIIGRGNDCGNEFDIEEQLDSESVYAMAPGADQLMVDGDSCNTQLQGVQPLFDADLAVLTGNGNSSSASIVSNSWGIGDEESVPPIYAQTAHAIDLRAAAEGVGMYFSSGDGPGINIPASDPYSISVGGTTLGIGASDNRLFETGWSNGQYQKFGGQWQYEGVNRPAGGAAGGGTSYLYAEPGYQKGVVPTTFSSVNGRSDRVVPDISADADEDSGLLEGVIELNAKGVPGHYQQFPVGGTSLASPLVAGMVADAQQGQAKSFGFINPLLYSLAGTGAFNATLPVTSSSPTYEQSSFVPAKIVGAPTLETIDTQDPAWTGQVTAPGYDTMTGLGTPNGAAFISGLRSGS